MPRLFFNAGGFHELKKQALTGFELLLHFLRKLFNLNDVMGKVGNEIDRFPCLRLEFSNRFWNVRGDVQRFFREL